MQIIARIQTLTSAVASDISAKMCLVRYFIGREANVAIDTEDTVFGFQISNVAIELGDFVYQTFYFLFIEVERKVVSLLVRSEPLSIVVSAEVAEEVDEICVIHCISPNINRTSICRHYKPYGQSAALFDEYYLFGKDTV